MFSRLGYQWAGSLLGFIALACCGIPFIFYFKGEAIRRHSKYAYVEDEENKKLEQDGESEEKVDH